jgi:hypothetical protein
MSPGQPGVSSEYCAPAHARPASAVHMAKTIDPAPRSTSLPLFLPGVGQGVLDILEPIPGTAPPFGRGAQAPAARDVQGFFFRRLRSEDKAPSGACSSKATDRYASGLGLRYLLANARASWLTAS